MKIAIPIADGKLTAHFGHCQEFALIIQITLDKFIRLLSRSTDDYIDAVLFK